MSEYIFVYGTLRPALAPPELRDVVRHWRLLGGGSVAGRLYDLGEYPGAILDPAARSLIVGEVYQLPNEDGLLRLLDRYEGFDSGDEGTSLFVRRICDVALDDGRRLECWVYVYNRETSASKLITDGDYLYARSQ